MDENMKPDQTNENNENPVPEENSGEFESFINRQVKTTQMSDSDSVAENTDIAVKTKTKGKAAALIAVIVLLLAATAGLLFFILNSNSSKLNLNKTVITVDGVESSAAEYYFMYTSIYSQLYYQYTEDQIKQTVKERIAFTNKLYADAKKAGYVFTDEDNAEIDAALQEITAAAESASMATDKYLSESICEGFTLDMFKSLYEKQFLAQKYYNDNTETIKKKYEGSEGLKLAEAKYAEEKKNYDMADVSYFFIDAAEENAKAKADAIAADVKNGASFADAVKTATGKSDAKTNDLRGFSYSQLSQEVFRGFSDFADWVFKISEDGQYENGKNAVTVIENSSADVIYVIYVNNAPARDDSLPVTVDYIQVDIDKDSAVRTPEELQLVAKGTANKIFKEFTDGDTSVASFSKLAANYDNGDDALVSADTFNSLTKSGQEDKAVKEWAFAEGRKAGDFALIESEDCYYILFYTSQASEPLWQQTLVQTLVSADTKNWEEEISAAGTDNLVADDDEIAKIIDFVKKSAQNAQMY